MTDRGRTFPRGLVLGLTMAEIAILIIFVLLLALAALLAREADKRQTAERKLDDYEQIETLFVDEELPDDPAALRTVLRERVNEHRDADSWRELAREIEATVPEPSVQEVVERIHESHIGRMSPAEAERLLEAYREVERADAQAELEQALEEAGISPSAGEIREMAAAMRAAAEQGMTPGEIRAAIENRIWNEAVDDARRSASPEELSDLLAAVRSAAERGLSPEQVRDSVDAQGRLQQALDERDREQERAENLERQLRSLGGGTDHPSCWYQADGVTTAYLFDVALTAGGRLVVDFATASPEVLLDASGRRLGTTDEARAFLPVGAVRLRKPLSPREFLRQTRPVHDWSRDNDPECRFFVRVFDRTAAGQKQLYKDQLQVVERPFYKLLVERSGLPPGLAGAVE